MAPWGTQSSARHLPAILDQAAPGSDLNSVPRPSWQDPFFSKAGLGPPSGDPDVHPGPWPTSRTLTSILGPGPLSQGPDPHPRTWTSIPDQTLIQDPDLYSRTPISTAGLWPPSRAWLLWQDPEGHGKTHTYIRDLDTILNQDLHPGPRHPSQGPDVNPGTQTSILWPWTQSQVPDPHSREQSSIPGSDLNLGPKTFMAGPVFLWWDSTSISGPDLLLRPWLQSRGPNLYLCSNFQLSHRCHSF